MKKNRHHDTLSTREVVALTGQPRRRLYELCAAGLLPRVEPGGSWPAVKTLGCFIAWQSALLARRKKVDPLSVVLAAAFSEGLER